MYTTKVLILKNIIITIFVEKIVQTPSNLYLQKNEDILNVKGVFRPGARIAAAALRRPKSDALKVKNLQSESRAKNMMFLKQILENGHYLRQRLLKHISNTWRRSIRKKWNIWIRSKN